MLQHGPYEADCFLPPTHPRFSLRTWDSERPKVYQTVCLTAVHSHLAFQLQNVSEF